MFNSVTFALEETSSHAMSMKKFINQNNLGNTDSKELAICLSFKRQRGFDFEIMAGFSLRGPHLKFFWGVRYTPVEAEAVQALLAWLVNRVESGAGILLLSAIWKSNTQQNHFSVQTKQLIICPTLSKDFLPRGPGSVGSVSKSDSDIHMEYRFTNQS